jgi:hypothetical protein
MNILFVIKNSANLRTLAPVLSLLDRRGHRVSLACKDVKSRDSHEQLQELVSRSAAIRTVELPFTRTPGWSDLASSLRRSADYLRYFDPVYRDADKLRARAEEEAPRSIRTVARATGALPGSARALRRALESVERCLEPPERLIAFLEEQSPDLVMVTPLIGFGTPQADVVRASRRLGIPVCFPVRSWDNLTNKGLLRDAPDLVLVWNDLQRAEAVELHGVPTERVVVTGAPAYDHWFDWRPSRTREQLCAEVGLDPGRPIVLYVASSQFIAPDEPDFVRQWVRGLRAHGGLLADTGLLIRPHPLAAEGFRDLDLGDTQTAIWPRAGEFPLGDAARRNYYDSIFHSAAVVGINTSAQIESAIVGRPVHTILAPEFRQTQAGTLHFQYLVDDDFGHVRRAASLPEHAEQLERSLREGGTAALNERFLLRFVRPFGLTTPATPLAVDAVEELGARGRRAADRGPVLAPAVRLALRPLAAREERLHRREKRVRAVLPLDDLRRTVRDSARGGGPVVAGPWLGDGVGELLYWIPFLRWAAGSTLELSERLIVVARPQTAAWYHGLDVRAEVPGEPHAVLDPGLVERNRIALSATDPWARLQDRRLDFAPFEPCVPPAQLDLPESFLAVDGLDPSSLRGDVVLLEALPDPAHRSAVIAASRGFVGRYGPDAYVAVLAGRPAVTFGAQPQDAHDLALARRLGEANFGVLHVAGSAGEAVPLALALAPPRAPASVP